MSERDSDFGSFLAGFLFGGLIGAAIALLYAPQSGEETRTVIKEKSIELRDKAVETAEETRQRAEKALEEARQRAEKAIEDTRVKADELTKLTRQRVIDLEQRGQVILDEQKSKVGNILEASKKPVKKEKGSDSPPAAAKG